MSNDNLYKKFGFNLDIAQEFDETLSKRLAVWLYENTPVYFRSNYRVYAPRACHPNLDKCPTSGKINLKAITLWQTQAQRDKGRSGRVSMKPGKAFRYIFPYLEDPQIESLVDAFKESFQHKEYTLRKGQDRESFAAAYSNKIEPQMNFDTRAMVKNLKNSCMSNKTFEYHGGDDVEHPAEIYASGDFTMYWLENSEGKIAARCVVYTNVPMPVAAPIYATTQAAVDRLKGAIKSDYPMCRFDHNDVTGAKVLLLRCDRGGLIAPYFDFSPDHFDDNGILGRGSYTGRDHVNGYAEEHNGCQCDNCGHTYDPDDEGDYFEGQNYCGSCYNDEVGFCECTEEPCLNDDLREVITSDIETQYWSDSSVRNHATEHNGDYYCDDSGLLFCSDWDGRWYLVEDEHAETVDGETIALSEIISDDADWDQNDDGLWYVKEPDADESDETTTKEEAA